ncbi:MAG: hypothetical protein ACOYBP_06230 [Microbacteriaceae bacterium]
MASGVDPYTSAMFNRWDEIGPAHTIALFGEHAIRVEARTTETLITLTQTFRHLTTINPQNCMNQIEVDSSANLPRLAFAFHGDDIELPPIPWSWTSPLARENDFSCTAVEDPRALIFSRESNRHMLIVLHERNESLLTRPEYLRLLLRPFLTELGLEPVHGGTLGTRESGVLLTNRGGSGKSSLVAAGALSGMQTTGDDFLLIDVRSPEPAVASMFCTLKLASSSPVHEASRSARADAPTQEGKDLFALDALSFGAMTDRQHLRALIVPYLSDRYEFREASHTEVLQAMLPNSLAMSSRPKIALERLQRLAEQLPCFAMGLTRDLERPLAEIRSLVA